MQGSAEAPAAEAAAGRAGAGDRWFPSGEKVVWEWLRLEDRLVEDAD